MGSPYGACKSIMSPQKDYDISNGLVGHALLTIEQVKAISICFMLKYVFIFFFLYMYHPQR